MIISIMDDEGKVLAEHPYGEIWIEAMARIAAKVKSGTVKAKDGDDADEVVAEVVSNLADTILEPVRADVLKEIHKTIERVG